MNYLPETLTLAQATHLYAVTEGAVLRSHAWKTWRKQWDEQWGDRLLKSITFDDIDRAITEAKACLRCNSTIRHRLSFLKQVWRVARERGASTAEFPCKIEAMKPRGRVRRQLTGTEEAGLRKSLHPLDRNIVELMLATGLSGVEVFQLEKRDVCIDTGRITVRSRPKASCEVRVTQPSTLEVLRTMLSNDSPTGLLVVPHAFGRFKPESWASRWQNAVLRPALHANGIRNFWFSDYRLPCEGRQS